MPSEKKQLEELLASAKTDEDLDAILDLIDQHDAKQAKVGRFVVSTLREVAEFFGIQEQTARTWSIRNPPMPGSHGAWNLQEIVRWREAWLSQAEETSPERQQAFALKSVKLEAERLELAKARNTLLHVEDVEHWASEVMVEFRDTIMQLREMLTGAAPPELKDFVREETDRHCRDALTNAARRLELKQIQGE